MTEKQAFLNKNFVQRSLSAVILTPLVLGGVWLGGTAYNVMVVVAMLVGLSEWLRLTAPRLARRGATLCYIALFLVFAAWAFKGMGAALVLSVLTMGLFAFYAARSDTTEERRANRAWLTGLGAPYLAWSGLAMLSLRETPDLGLFYIVYLLMVVWGTDIGAYFAGRLIGGAKIWPQISPKKTWAGLFGGMALASLLGYLVADGFAQPFTGEAAGIAAFLAVISQAGDFFESWIKRRAGAKDSGKLIPGHGGLLDRVDGLLFAATAMALIKYIGE